MTDDLSDIPSQDSEAIRRRRREADRARLRRKRGWTMLAWAALLGVIVAGASALGGSSASHRPGRAVRATIKPAVISGGPLAPASVGGLAALWARQNVVGAQPGTASAYEAASKRTGLPGYLMIADRGNNRILVVNRAHQVVVSYPNAADIATGRRLYYDDDVFVEPGGAALISNEEDNNDIVQVDLADRSLHVLFGHLGEAGSDATHVHTPDDAYMLPDGTFTVADAYGCRIIFVRNRRIVHQYGTSGACRHEPPRYLDAVNGDTPNA
jgi:hypothetical protein